MARSALLAGGLATIAATGACAAAPPNPEACDPVPPQVTDAPDGAVWGFADLHAHPAIERAFGGRLIWGTAVDPEPVSGAALPRIDACPVETHDRDLTSPIDRAVGAELFPNVGAARRLRSRAGGQHRLPSHERLAQRTRHHPPADERVVDPSCVRRRAAPDVRVDHRRPGAVGAPLRADPRQWLRPGPARRLCLGEGAARLDPGDRRAEPRLDVDRAESSGSSGTSSTKAGSRWSPRSNERLRDVAPNLSLVTDYGVRHVLPIHLIDNDVGGTAANGDLFNASSAAVSENLPERQGAASLPLGRRDAHVRAAARLAAASRHAPAGTALRRPRADPVLALRRPLLQPLAACSGTAATGATFLEFGQQNVKGCAAPRPSVPLPASIRGPGASGTSSASR